MTQKAFASRDIIYLRYLYSNITLIRTWAKNTDLAQEGLRLTVQKFVRGYTNRHMNTVMERLGITESTLEVWVSNINTIQPDFAGVYLALISDVLEQIVEESGCMEAMGFKKVAEMEVETTLISEDLLNTKLMSLQSFQKLSKRIHNSFAGRYGHGESKIETFRDLLSGPHTKLLQRMYFGRKALNELKHWLETEFDGKLHLGMDL